jgi:GNAT superfamily N-acetyltransferase
VDATGKPVGYWFAVHEAWAEPGYFYSWVVVEREARCQGIGSALLEAGLERLREHGAAKVTADVREGFAAGIQFGERRGFRIHRHLFESVLDLTTFDESPYQNLIPSLEAQGIRFFSMADAGDTLEARRKLYAVNSITAMQIPGTQETWMPFEAFNQQVCGADWYNPEGQLVAATGEEWIGLAAVQLIPEDHSAYNLMTGVLEAYRGRKIATALKLVAIRYAREHGALSLRTHNSSLNEPMLAVNRKLGYVPRPGFYKLIREGI